MCSPTRLQLRGRLIRLGEMSEDDAHSLHRGTGGSTYTRKARRQPAPPSDLALIAEVAPERFPHQDRGVVHPNPLQPVQLADHRGFPFRLRSKSISTGPRVAGLDNRITLGFHLVDLPHHQRQPLQSTSNLTLQEM